MSHFRVLLVIASKKMRHPTSIVFLALATGTDAFVPALSQKGMISHYSAQWPRVSCHHVSTSAAASTNEDCGCGGAIVSGRPSDAAKAMDPRVAVAKSTLLTLDGAETSMNQILGEPSNSGTSLVVFLRSLG